MKEQFGKLIEEYRKIIYIVISLFPQFIKRSFTENLSIKLISIFITLTLFIIIAGESVQLSKRVKIEYQTPDKMMIVNEVPFEFEMILSGPKSLIGTITSQDFYYKVDLTLATPGSSRVRLDPRELNLSRGIMVSSVMPSTIYPKLEKIISKSVPLELKQAGESPVKYLIRSITVDPKDVQIVGPQSKVEAIQAIKTESFDMGQVKGTHDYTVTIESLDPQISIESFQGNKVKIHVEVFKKKD